MANIITQYCNNWSRPIRFHLLATGLVVCSMVVRMHPYFSLSLLLFAVTSLGVVISSIYQFVHKQTKAGIVTGLTLFATMIGLVIVAMAIGYCDIVVNNVQL